MCLSLAQAIALHLHYIYGTGPADVPHEGGDDEVHVHEAALSPQGHRSVDKGPANVEEEAGQVLLPVAGVYWDSPVRQFLPSKGRR